MIKGKSLSKNISKDAAIYLGALFLSAMIFFLFGVYINSFVTIEIPQRIFLMFHVFAELISIVIAIAIFVVLYFTFDLFKRKHYLILANTFLIVGILDVFHTLTYKGMYDLFFSGLQTPTYFWILSRFILGAGLIWSFSIKKEKTTTMKKEEGLLVSAVLIITVFLMSITYVDYLPRLFIEGQGLTKFKVYSEYFIVTTYLAAIGLYCARIKGDYSKSNVHMLSGLILSVFSELTFTLYLTVFDTSNMAGHVLKIISYSYIFWAVFVKNVRRPYEHLYLQRERLSLNLSDMEMNIELKSHLIMEQNKKLALVNKKMNDDLIAATEIQKAIFPEPEIQIHDISFSSMLLPCDQLSGDFVNYFKIDEDNLGFYIMDVSGHGVYAAMLGVFASKTIGETIRIEKKNSSVYSPASVLTNFYNLFNKSNFPDEIHIVMLYGLYNKKTQKICISSAGINCSPVLIEKGKAARYLNIESGFPICRLGDVFQPEFEDYEIDMKKGDKLFIYTDGLSELKNERGEFLGNQNILDFINLKSSNNSQTLNRNLSSFISEYKGDQLQDDDITYCIIEKL